MKHVKLVYEEDRDIFLRVAVKKNGEYFFHHVANDWPCQTASQAVLGLREADDGSDLLFRVLADRVEQLDPTVFVDARDGAEITVEDDGETVSLGQILNESDIDIEEIMRLADDELHFKRESKKRE